MDRLEVRALISPTRQRQSFEQTKHVKNKINIIPTPREQIILEELEAEVFLKALEERLQQHSTHLNDMTLVLRAKQINYLAFRLHEVLEPKRDPETHIIHAWTIQTQPPKVKMRSHIQVLKLSTILREVRWLRIQQQSLVRSCIEVDIFPSLRSIEIIHTEITVLANLCRFAQQLRHLYVEQTVLISLRQILSLTDVWKQLQVLQIHCCSLPTVDASVNNLVAIEQLDFGWNEIHHFEVPLTCTSVQSLVLCHNQLSMIPPVARLVHLRELDLSMNHIGSLSGIETLIALERLDVSNNQLRRIEDMEWLTNLTRLQRVYLKDNPLSRRPDHRREVLFYLGENVELDDMPWTAVEKTSMKHSRRVEALSNQSLKHATWSPSAIVMGYPQLPPQMVIQPQFVEIQAPPRRYASQRWRQQQNMTSFPTPMTDGASENEVDDDEALEDQPTIRTVNDYFQVQEQHHNIDTLVAIDLDNDPDESSHDVSSDTSENRSRKYTESDFMQDFEEETILIKEQAIEPIETHLRRSSKTSLPILPRRNSINASSSTKTLDVRVLLSVEDAAVFDLSFGIDGISASLDIKRQEILETLHVPDRQSAISFVRRLPDIIAIGTSTHSQRAKIIMLQLRKHTPFTKKLGNVTYQVDLLSTFGRVLRPLLENMYSFDHSLPPIAYVCLHCGGISHVTREYLNGITTKVFDPSLFLHSCLLCLSLNVREITRERMLAVHASEGITLAKRVKLSTTDRLNHVNNCGFYVEEDQLEGKSNCEMYDCEFVASWGVRESPMNLITKNRY